MKRQQSVRARAARRLCAGLITAAFITNIWADAGQVEPLSAGARVTYRDTAGHEWCATVAAVEVGVDGQQTAWLKIDADPRRLARAPVSELVAGCRL